jgi:hypothetical protein
MAGVVGMSLGLASCTRAESEAKAGTDAVLVVEGPDVRACEALLAVRGGELEAPSGAQARVQLVRREGRVGLAVAALEDRPLSALPLRWRGGAGTLEVEKVTCFDGHGVAVPGVSLRLENRTS